VGRRRLWMTTPGTAARPAHVVCKTRTVLKIDADEPALIDMGCCNGCGDCLPGCPHATIAIGNAYSSSNSVAWK